MLNEMWIVAPAGANSILMNTQNYNGVATVGGYIGPSPSSATQRWWNTNNGSLQAVDISSYPTMCGQHIIYARTYLADGYNRSGVAISWDIGAGNVVVPASAIFGADPLAGIVQTATLQPTPTDAPTETNTPTSTPIPPTPTWTPVPPAPTSTPLTCALPAVANGDFSSGLNSWSNSGDVIASNNTALFNSADSAVDGVIEQVVGTCPGHSYNLNFSIDFVGACWPPKQRILAEVVDNASGSNLTQTASTYGTSGGYGVSFTAQGPVTLRFTDISDDFADCDISLDNVTLP
ncbi:MAG TPA: hypothetical protein P5317_11665 [Myxococcota bacterium]|nr:hypothetical protein [Myxococcota bacterium]HRV18651.1 hypothetical protein [Myxococcota bacterium]